MGHLIRNIRVTGREYQPLPADVGYALGDRLWTVYDETKLSARLAEGQPLRHNVDGVFLEDRIHDYQIKLIHGQLCVCYYSRVTDGPVTIYIERV